MRRVSVLTLTLLAAACSTNSTTSSTTPDPTPSDDTVLYTISGTASGLVGFGEVLLYNNEGDELWVDKNGEFSFETQVETGSSYDVSIDFSAHYLDCEVANGSGTVDEADVSDITVTCGTGTFAEIGTEGAVAIGPSDLVTSANEYLDSPVGTVAYANGLLFVPDKNDNRILIFDGIPTESGAEPVGVLGKADLDNTDTDATSAGTFSGPADIATDGEHLVVADKENNRVLIFNSIPASTGGVIDADIVLGQEGDFTASDEAVGENSMDYPESVWIVDGKLLVADSDNNRVLIYDTFPTSSEATPDLVLGQDDLDHNDFNGEGHSPGANTLYYPSGVWSDGTMIIVADQYNYRVMIWSSWPTENNADADYVLGADDKVSDVTNPISATASNFDYVSRVSSDGEKIYVSDLMNYRVLVFDYPESDGESAVAVIGQSDFENDDADTSEDRFGEVGGMTFVGNQLLVTDTGNNRVVVFNQVDPN